MTLDAKKLPRIGGMESCRAAARAFLVPACLALFGCTVQTGLPGPNVILSTPTGPAPLYAPAQSPAGPGNDLAVPPGLEPASPPPPAQTGNRNGTYSGRAEVLTTAGGICDKGMNVDNFKVHGNSVRFGQFRGTIAPDGGLQMVFGGTWIIGQFEGATFRGQADFRGRRGSPGCVFVLTLDRTGP
jgi:hypothetical protein